MIDDAPLARCAKLLGRIRAYVGANEQRRAQFLVCLVASR